MTDRPLARFHEGSLWLDDGGHYRPADRFAVLMKRECMSSLTGKHAAQKVAECQAALDQYEQHQQANSGQTENT